MLYACIPGGMFVGTDVMCLYVVGIIPFCYILFYFYFIIFVGTDVMVFEVSYYLHYVLGWNTKLYPKYVAGCICQYS